MVKSKRDLNDLPKKNKGDNEGTPEEVLVLTKAEVDELKNQLEAAQKKEQETLDALQRERADFINFRKRNDRDVESRCQNFKSDIMMKYIAVLDDLELAMRNCPKTNEKMTGWVDGIELVLRKLETINQAEGLERIETENVPFDPTVHQAVSHEEDPETESGMIIDVLQNGYKLGDRVIRPALVRVAK